MPRNRFSLLDLQAEVRYLQRRLVGCRVVNIYDITPTTYLLKISVPRNAGATEETPAATDEYSNSNWEKTFILIESGIRVHETRFYREKSNIPSGFSVKLRKHIRSRKIQQIRTIGADRVIEIVFGSRTVEGTLEGPCRLIVEFYSSGNIILTDEEYTILSALRSYKGPFGVTKEPVHIFTRNKYPVHLLRSNISLSKEAVLALLKEAPQTETVRNFLASNLSCGPQVIEHALAASGYGLKTKIKDLLSGAECREEEGLSLKTSTFLDSLESFGPCLFDVGSDNLPLDRGYIFYSRDFSEKEDQSTDPSVSNSEGIRYEDFSPFVLCHLKAKPYFEFSTFNEAVDVYFANLEKERSKLATSKQESAVSKKVESLRRDLERRVEELERMKEENFKIAEAIELNAEEVDKAIWVVRAMLAGGISWKELEKMLEEERDKGNPVAEIIHSLHLDRNEITLMLSVDPVVEEGREGEDDLQHQSLHNGWDYTDETEEDFEKERIFAELNASKPVVLAEVDLSLSAFANAARYFESRKRAQEKKEKTLEASKKALNVAEKKATKLVERSQQRSLKPAVAIREIRKPAWFEKFDWFISSENFLIIAGKDAQQNELVVKRYMRACDVYVHADIHGASSVVVKNPVKDKPIPLQTLIEAGAFAMCHSSAWNSKIVSSAWWVHANQVSKTAPSGEYLTTGSFMIRGKKNYLPPSQLVMGYGILFKMDPSCLKDHENERKRLVADTPSATEESVELKDYSTENDSRHEDTIIPSEGTASFQDQYETESGAKETDVEQLFDKYEESLPDSLREMQLDSGTLRPEREDTESQFWNDADSEIITHSTAKNVKKISKQGKTNPSKTPEQKKPSIADSMENIDLNKLPRGKRSKMKRAKKKYAEQTLEERKLAMALLGSSKLEDMSSLRNDAEERREEVTPNLEREKHCNGTENHVKPVTSYKEERKIPEEEEETNNKESLTDETSIIHLFTGQPLESDILEFAIPVCAPFAAVSRYKYRVKLIPGTMKKGKAAKMANTLLLKMAEKNGNSRDKDLMRAIPEQDSIQTMISNVKILSPGLQEVTSKKKNK